MDASVIALRCQDFHESLRNTTTAPAKDVHFEKTLLIGKAASLAMHLRGLPFVANATHLKYAAASLGISSIELATVLRELETVDFVNVTRSSTGEIKRIDVRVPVFSSGYNVLGSRYLDLRPGEIENAGIQTLDALHAGPQRKEHLVRTLGLDRPAFAILNDVMDAGKLMAAMPLGNQTFIYSPLAVDGNPTAYVRWAAAFPSEVAAVLQSLRTKQGLAESTSLLKSNPAVPAAVHAGVLMPVEIKGATGKQRFFFAPHGGLSSSERTILDKARAVVSCLRYGQGFAAGTRIRSPLAVLNTLIDRKKFGKAHPDLGTQYGILTDKLIGTVEPEGIGFNFHIHDTDENMRALRLAYELLETGESVGAKLDPDAQKALLTPQGYTGPLTTRPQFGSSIDLSDESQAEMLQRMADIIRGMRANG